MPAPAADRPAAAAEPTELSVATGPTGPVATDRTVVPALVPAAIAVGLAILAIQLRWRGSDLPAHFFRVGLVERGGFGVWNNYWYGGHHTLGYGVLFPILGATLGIWPVAVLSAGSSAFLADILIRRATGRRCLAASLLFAVGTLTNVAVGRLPFALGLSVGLAALLAAQGRRWPIAVALSIATAAASPVVSAFLALIYAAWALSVDGRARRWFAVLAAASILPVVVISWLYPQGGTFPFRWGALLWSLLIVAAMLALVPAEQRLVRWATILYALAALGAFVVPTPLGANLTRFGMFAAAPVLLAVVPARRVVLAVMVPALLFWQWSPALDAIFRSGRDPSVELAYYRPLLGFLATRGAETERIEVVPTGRHWETAFVAARYPIARGWERQLDVRFHPLFYEDGLTPDVYRQWLLDEGVGLVALSDVVPDRSGEEEAALLEQDLPFLREVLSTDHWRVWEVIDSPGMVDGPAEVLDVAADSVTLDVSSRADIVVRVRASAFWASDPAVCIEPTADDWIILRDVPPGPIEVYLDESEPITGRDDPCEPL